MRRSRAASTVVVLGCLGSLAVACRKDATPRPDPATGTSASTSTSTSPSAAPSPSSADEAPPPPYECVDGKLRRSTALARAESVDAGGAPATDGGHGGAIEDGFGTGLGLSGVGAGSGDRVDGGGAIGLGALPSGLVGGVAPGLGLAGATGAPRVTARLVAPSGASGLAAARVLCSMGSELRRCANAASAPGWPAREKARYALELRGDGALIATKLVAGAMTDATLGGCLVRAFGGVSFPAGTPNVVTEIEIGPEAPPSVRLREDSATIRGALPEAVVRRIIRASFPKFRVCYEALRRSDEGASGTVSTSFVIDATGAVTAAKADAGTITDATMRGCVQKAFASLSFPQPDAGTVSVTYPISFTAD